MAAEREVAVASRPAEKRDEKAFGRERGVKEKTLGERTKRRESERGFNGSQERQIEIEEESERRCFAPFWRGLFELTELCCGERERGGSQQGI